MGRRGVIRMNRIRRIYLGLLVALGIVLAGTAADAHSKLVQSSPAADSILATSPAEIRLKFNEPMEAELARVGLTTAEGGEVVLGPATTDQGDKTELVVPIKDTLSPGAYHVHWQAVSDDMHKVEGDFAFEVRP